VAFGEWAERWFRTTADLKPASRRTYRKLLDYQILPTFERASLSGIDTLAVPEWIAGLGDAPCPTPEPASRPL
jgi:Phage integrase, N-terminal SAM-like domain